MASIFTEHVRQFDALSDPAHDVLPELARLLKQRMRRKNLLSAPPSYLGYGAAPSWGAPGAFDDIVVDCYVYAILNRLRGLRARLALWPNIDGLVVRNIDQFLIERQRRQDPVGYAVFSNVEGAARPGAATGLLAVEGPADGRLRSDSVLRLDLSRMSAGPAELDEIKTALARADDWGKALPSLVVVSEEGQEWVVGFLARLKQTGLAAVRCGDLVAVLAAQARGDRAAAHAVVGQDVAFGDDDDFRAVVRMVRPDEGFADRESWDKLKRELAGRIAGSGRQQRVRERLSAVFAAVIQHIEEGATDWPSQADLVARLGIPRATLSDDMRSLQAVIEEFREENPDV